MRRGSYNDSSYRRRRAGGNMLLMLVMVVAVIVVVCGVGFIIYLMMFAQKRTQNEADAIALTAATTLNSADRQGQMNNLIARCRELVFVSRESHQYALQNYRHLEPLARQLLEESRSSARTLEQERRRLVQIELNDIRAAMARAETASGESPSLSVPGLTSYAPKILRLDVGLTEGVQSNVEVSGGNPELKKSDLDRGLIEKESGLYRGNINAKLLGQDSDLDFKLSSLPAPVKGSIAPPRLTSSDVFRNLASLIKDGGSAGGACDQLPSAVQVSMLLRIATGAGDKKEQEHQVEVKSTAATSGARPPP